MEFKDVVTKRYSCKKYSDRQIEPEKLNAILEAGRVAPTAKNLLNSTYMWLSRRKHLQR